MLEVFSDHNVMHFSTNVLVNIAVTQHQTFDYPKGDDETIRQELRKVEWKKLLQGSMDQQWNSFKKLLEELEQQHIPEKSVDGSKRWKA